MDIDRDGIKVIKDDGGYPPALRKYLEQHMEKFRKKQVSIKPTTSFEPGQKLIANFDGVDMECTVLAGPEWKANRETGRGALVYDVIVDGEHVPCCAPEDDVRLRQQDLQ